MKLSKTQAEQIVKELSSVITQHVNMMDESGEIIASTDLTRVGTIHGGAINVLENHLSELVIDTEEEFVGARNGVNLPIIFDGAIVGVVGITGKSDEVKKYGQIIKKMTEILMLESYVKEQTQIEQKIHSRFIEELVFGQRDAIEEQDFVARGEAINVNATLKYRVIVFSVVNQSAYSSLELTEVSRAMRRLIEGVSNCHFLRTLSKYIVLIENPNNNSVYNFALRIKNQVESLFDLKVAVGIDSNIKDLSVKDAYVMAEKACRSSMSVEGNIIKFYEDIDFELFLNEIKQPLKREFVEKVFCGESSKEIGEWVKLLSIFYEYNGSLLEVSEKLFIHKNTLQYKLNKIKQITGYDPRNFKHSAVFNMAILFYNSIEYKIL